MLRFIDLHEKSSHFFNSNAFLKTSFEQMGPDFGRIVIFKLTMCWSEL